MRGFRILCLTLLLPLAAVAQEKTDASDEDKGMLTRFLEDSLSGAGRSVEVVGLRGAISSEATIEALNISDADGLWLSLTGLTLNWNRLAVLRGNININELSAKSITLVRAPKTDPKAASAEATPFALPELPVSINIQKLQADRISLGDSLLGQPVDLSLVAKLVLEGGNAETLLKAARLDGPAGQFVIDGAFSNETRNLRIDIQAHEDAGGLIATLARLPGAPEIGLTVLGEGLLEDFIADIRMTSAGEERLAGSVELATEPGPTEEAPVTRLIKADLAGNMAPLFAPEYQDFFGDRIALDTDIALYGDGRTELENLLLTSQSLNVTGDLALAPGGLPERFGLTILLKDPDQDPVLLPISGPKSYVDIAELRALYDQTQGDTWTLDGTLSGVNTDALTLDTLVLSGSGTIAPGPPRSVAADLTLDMAGLVLADPALAQAVGSQGRLSSRLTWADGQDVDISTLSLNTDALTLHGSAAITGQGATLAVAADVDLDVPDLTRFSTLAKRDLSGATSAKLNGHYVPLSGGFDIDLTASGQDLTINDPRVDALLKGQTDVRLSAKRDDAGLTLRTAKITSEQLSLAGQGTLASTNSAVDLDVTLADSSLLLDTLSGPLTVSGHAHQTEADWSLDLDATAPADSTAKIHATVPAQGGGTAQIDLKIGKVEVFVPTLPGAAEIHATAEQTDAGWQISYDATGPFDTSGTGSGLLDVDNRTADLALTGSLPLAAANPVLQPNSVQGLARYDLTVNGPLELSSVAGTVTVSDARFALPDLRVALTEIGGTVTLAGSAAQIAMTTNFSAGGQIAANGSLSLAPPFSANLPITLTGVKIEQGQLLKTSLDGTVTLSGPLTGGGTIAGDLQLGQTDIRVSAAALSGIGPIPEIRHVGASGSVTNTRDRAGLIPKEKTSGPPPPPFGLDVSIKTAERISVRGLGLNADFDGGMTIGGTTNEIVPNGELDLIRGRLAFLSKEFELDEGRIAMLGDLVPTMRVQATSDQRDATIRVILDGRLDNPQIILESDPELPQDEVLSQLLFGRDLSGISALQAAQLAAALATLAGNGPSGPRLGENSGLDTLGLTFDESGTPGVRAGKYINENVYTEIGVDKNGEASINLNLDVTKNLTVKGKIGSDEDSGIGLFFQRDY